MLPTVDFCGLSVTRLIIGANPFGGFSHQSPERNEEMRGYHTPERIKETWARAEAAGINTMITNNHSENVTQAVCEYLADSGPLQWIVQLSPGEKGMFHAIDEAADIGAAAMYLHGGILDRAYPGREEGDMKAWLDHIRSHGVPAGVAGHAPEAHLWFDSVGAADFHVVAFFNCGSLHHGEGARFRLADMPAAVESIRTIRKPCIGYKIMAAGRIDAQMAFEYAFDNIKPADVVNVGMHRGDKDDIVEENVAMVREILGC